MVTYSSNIKLKILNKSFSPGLGRVPCNRNKTRTNIFFNQESKSSSGPNLCNIFQTALFFPRQHCILLFSHPLLNLSKRWLAHRSRPLGKMLWS
jgi:hypothetical protein